MEKNNDNTRRLMEMLDHPDAYSEQEINDIINSDDSTRDTYRLIVEARRASRWRQARQTADVDAAWQRFEQQHYSRCLPVLSWKKVAASFVGLLLVSGIALAAIHIVRQTPLSSHGEDTNTAVPAGKTVVVPSGDGTDTSLGSDSTAVAPVVFDNVPLDQMLTEMSAHYGVETLFLSDSARHLRFYFVWNKEQPLQRVVETLNRFERLDIVIDHDKLIVR